MQSALAELAQRNRHNLRTLRESPLSEISGALGDLGTLLPLMIALARQRSINLSSTLVFSGLFNIVTGVVFGIPLPVQPMKAIAAASLSTPLSLPATTAAGALVSLAVLALTLTGALRLLTTHVPVPVIKGIQLGAALRLVSSGAALIRPLPWLPPPLTDARLSAAVLFLLLLATHRLAPRFPSALVLTALAVLIPPLDGVSPHAAAPPSHALTNTATWFSPPFPPPAQSYPPFLAQLPLTTLNSILAVPPLAASLLPSTTTLPSTTSLGLSVAFMNLLSCPFGAMPVCHGAGGLAGQVRFGARSGAAVVLLGVVKMGLGFVAGRVDVAGMLGGFSPGVLGVM
ncbi:putative sulfate transporter, partial [Staphylotrichum tortipilum]